MEALLEVGGIAHASTLKRVVTDRQLRKAVRDGRIIRVTRGRYSLPGVDEHRQAAASTSAVLDRLSAARHWEWPVKLPPEQPQLLVPRGRNVSTADQRLLDVRWGVVTPAELEAGVTSKVRTVLECARFLPFDDAVAVVDSALRDGVTKTELLLACARLPRWGRSRAYRVVEFGSKKAANPFESVLRATVHDVAGAQFEPQVWVGNVGRADLVDRRRRLVVEADSFEFHSDAASLNRDIVRYNAFVSADHRLLRFGWKHAMFEQDYVRATVGAVIRLQERSVGACPGCTAA